MGTTEQRYIRKNIDRPGRMSDMARRVARSAVTGAARIGRPNEIEIIEHTEVQSKFRSKIGDLCLFAAILCVSVLVISKRSANMILYGM